MPLSVEKQILAVFAGTQGFLDDVELSDLKDFELGLYQFFETRYGNLLEALKGGGKISDEVSKQLGNGIEEFKERFQNERPQPESSE